MKFKLCAALILLPVIVACGGGGSDSPTDGGTTDGATTDGGSTDGATTDGGTTDGSTTDGGTTDGSTGGGTTTGGTTGGDTALLFGDREPPAAGTQASSVSIPVRDNRFNPGAGAADITDEGPVVVDRDNQNDWPYLRFGDFIMANNPWQQWQITYPDWHQSTQLIPSADGTSTAVQIDWDLGVEDTHDEERRYDTKTFPEMIFGVKGLDQESGTTRLTTFDETGLPQEFDENMPHITIDYAYTEVLRASAEGATPANGTQNENNIAVESFFHETCEPILRTGDPDTDNQVMEVMVWLKASPARLPSGDADRGTMTTTDGRVWTIYTKLGGNKPNDKYIAYVANEEQISGSVQYSELLEYARTEASRLGIYQLKTTDCFANILAGVEVWHGAGTVTFNEFTVHRQY